MSGRSSRSTDRAVLDKSSTPCSIRLTTTKAVSPFAPLAIANRVSTVFGIWCAMGQAVRPGELNLATAVHRHHAGETVLAGDRVDRLGQGVLGVIDAV